MKNLLILLTLLFNRYPSGNYQKANAACDLLSTVQINSILGCNVKDGKSMMQDKYCVHKADDNRVQVIVQYIEFSNPQAAQNMLKMAYDENEKNIQAGKKAVGIYTALKLFNDAGASAYYMTSPGNTFSPGNSVRLQFVLGKAMFSFDTESIEKDKVISKLTLIFKAIKESYKI